MWKRFSGGRAVLASLSADSCHGWSTLVLIGLLVLGREQSQRESGMGSTLGILPFIPNQEGASSSALSARDSCITRRKTWAV